MLILLFDGGKTHEGKASTSKPSGSGWAGKDLQRYNMLSTYSIKESKGKWEIPCSGHQAWEEYPWAS